MKVVTDLVNEYGVSVRCSISRILNPILTVAVNRVIHSTKPVSEDQWAEIEANADLVLARTDAPAVVFMYE